MPDDPAIFLIRARQEAGDIYDIDQRDLERITETDEPGRFVRSIDIQAAGHDPGLVGDDPHGRTVQPCQAGDDVPGIHPMRFHIFSVVHDAPDHLVHVVGHLGAIRDDGIQAFVHPVGTVSRIVDWRAGS